MALISFNSILMLNVQHHKVKLPSYCISHRMSNSTKHSSSSETDRSSVSQEILLI